MTQYLPLLSLKKAKKAAHMLLFGAGLRKWDAPAFVFYLPGYFENR